MRIMCIFAHIVFHNLQNLRVSEILHINYRRYFCIFYFWHDLLYIWLSSFYSYYDLSYSMEKVACLLLVVIKLEKLEIRKLSHCLLTACSLLANCLLTAW